MKLSQFDFNLPKTLIAQKPASPRDACRLMVLDRKTKSIKHDHFYNLGEYLRPGDVLVLNDSKVLPARIIGKKPTGGKAEILLLKQLTSNNWDCLVGFVPIKKQAGLEIIFKSGLKGKIIKRQKDTAIIKFNQNGQKLMNKILAIGQAPTPPYIKRLAKRQEYQTIFAKKLGSVAAPTAGLHFTKNLLKKLKKQGLQIEYITLHVGLGTFQPVKTEDIRKHQMHEEYFELSKTTAKNLNEAKREGRRIIAVGTTVTRVLETCAGSVMVRFSNHDTATLREPQGDSVALLKPRSSTTNIFIYPGYKFKFIDALITNFHVPKSTLIMLVEALAGKKLIDQAYQIAIKKKYQFYSFGDAMVIL